jgi:PPOX class probable F420-dependent enzyme
MSITVTRLPDSAIELIRSGAHGHLVTINPDGSPQVSMVWVGVEGDELWIPSLTPRRKLDNVRRDPRVAVSFESPDHDVAGERGSGGLRLYLAVRGTARVTDGGGPELLQRLAATYLGPGVKFPPGDDPPPGWIMRITPARWHGYGPWTTPDAAERERRAAARRGSADDAP